MGIEENDRRSKEKISGGSVVEVEKFFKMRAKVKGVVMPSDCSFSVKFHEGEGGKQTIEKAVWKDKAKQSAVVQEIEYDFAGLGPDEKKVVATELVMKGIEEMMTEITENADESINLLFGSSNVLA